MIEPLVMLMLMALMAAGFVVATLWLVGALRALDRRDDPAAAAGTGRAALGAFAGVSMGVVTGCTGLLGVIGAAGGSPDLPEFFYLAVLAIPVGLIACPGLVLWGTVVAWRAAERDPVHGASPADLTLLGPSPADAPDGLDALDAPFHPSPFPERDDEPAV